MSNIYIILSLLALVAFIQSVPTTNRDYQDEKSAFDDKNEASRDLKNKIDGTTHRINTAGISYRQRVRGGECFVEYDNKFLSENNVITIRKKTYRVEDCLLERVFHACGTNLLLMLNVVCQVVEQHAPTANALNFKRDTSPSFEHDLDSSASKTTRMITESCCENLCTVSELTRYCYQ